LIYWKKKKKKTAATLLRDIPGSFAYFYGYEFFKRNLAKEGETLNPWKTLFAGGMAGICNWLVAIPPDVLKSRLQTAPEGTYPNGIRDVFKGSFFFFFFLIHFLYYFLLLY